MDLIATLQAPFPVKAWRFDKSYVTREITHCAGLLPIVQHDAEEPAIDG